MNRIYSPLKNVPDAMVKKVASFTMKSCANSSNRAASWTAIHSFWLHAFASKVPTLNTEFDEFHIEIMTTTGDKKSSLNTKNVRKNFWGPNGDLWVWTGRELKRVDGGRN